MHRNFAQTLHLNPLPASRERRHIGGDVLFAGGIGRWDFVMRETNCPADSVDRLSLPKGEG
jgi:hypothetical protein